MTTPHETERPSASEKSTVAVAIRPAAAKERIEILDVLRGLAIGGILLGNIKWFSGFGFMPGTVVEQGSAMDQFLVQWVRFFIDGKFYSIFSFLFGYSFALQMARAEAAGDLEGSLFKRRLTWLLVMGLLHTYLLWAGDILTLYAALGFVLLWFRHRTNTTLIRWAGVLLLLPAAIAICMGIVSAAGGGNEPVMAADSLQRLERWNRRVAEVAEGSYLEILSGYNLRYLRGRYYALLIEWRVPKVLAMFLLGLYAYRRGLFSSAAKGQAGFRRLERYGLGLGVITVLTLGPMLLVDGLGGAAVSKLAWILSDEVGVVLLAFFYICLTTTLWEMPFGRRWLAHLAPVGRTALTNYLLQSLICLLLFYGYGFGLFGRLAPTEAMAVAVGIFLVQVLLSNVWCRHFRYGPMEWVWRQLTYRRRLDLRLPS